MKNQRCLTLIELIMVAKEKPHTRSQVKLGNEWRFLKKYFARRILLQEEGVLSVAFIFSTLIIFLIFGLVSFSVMTKDSRSTVNFKEATQAQYLAEAGIQYGLKRLVQGDTSDYAESVSIFGDTFNLAIDNQDSLIQLISTGVAYSAQKSLEVQFVFAENFTIFSGDTMDFASGTGTITGDVHSNATVVIGAHTVTGTITQAPITHAPPTADWTFFENQAIADGQKVIGDKTFTQAGNPHAGVWYVTGDATINQNVVINGTLVVESDCIFAVNNIEITATPPNYPAVVAGGNVIGAITINNIDVNGFVYCGNDWSVHGNNLTVNGAIFAINSVNGDGNNKAITFDESYTANLQGIRGLGNRISWREL